MMRTFKYLGLMISMKDSASKVRLITTRSLTSYIGNIWQDDDISINLKKRRVYFLLWSVAQYGSESWTLKKVNEKRSRCEHGAECSG